MLYLVAHFLSFIVRILSTMKRNSEHARNGIPFRIIVFFKILLIRSFILSSVLILLWCWCPTFAPTFCRTWSLVSHFLQFLQANYHPSWLRLMFVWLILFTNGILSVKISIIFRCAKNHCLLMPLSVWTRTGLKHFLSSIRVLDTESVCVIRSSCKSIHY